MARSRLSPRVGIGTLGVALTALLVVVALVGPSLPFDANRQDLVARLSPPWWAGGTPAHPLGTDQLGRDLLARVVAGARVSLLVGLAATLGAGTLGVALGLVAGFAGGVPDRVVSWFGDVQLAVPFVVVAIALAATFRPGLGTVLLTLILTGWVAYAPVVRLQVRSLRRAPWVEAARAVGASPGRIATRHLLPNLVGVVAVLATQQVAAMILYEAALSYLGLGVGASTITWGGMVADGRETLLIAPWVSVVPGVALALAVLGFNLLGDRFVETVAVGWRRRGVDRRQRPNLAHGPKQRSSISAPDLRGIGMGRRNRLNTATGSDLGGIRPVLGAGAEEKGTDRCSTAF